MHGVYTVLVAGECVRIADIIGDGSGCIELLVGEIHAGKPLAVLVSSSKLVSSS